MNSIIHLNPHHQSEIIDLLKSHNLPCDDIDLNRHSFVGYFDKTQLVAIGALEILNEIAIVRSMAVTNTNQNTGLGTGILEHLIDTAKKLKLTSLYLLTETAESFFKGHGFVVINRMDVPDHVANSPEFKHLCPDSAICMTINLTS